MMLHRLDGAHAQLSLVSSMRLLFCGDRAIDRCPITAGCKGERECDVSKRTKRIVAVAVVLLLIAEWDVMHHGALSQ